VSANRAQGTRGLSRRERERRTRRNERFIIGGVIGVLAVASVVVLIGLYITQYLPPRAHVLRVEDNDYNASEVARRAFYELQFGAVGAGGLEQVVDETLDRIRDAEVVLRRAPARVGEATDEDVDAALRERLGFEDSDDVLGFADAFARLLQTADLSRDEFEQIVRSEILAERLRDSFAAEYGEEADQLQLSRIRVADEATAEEIRELAAAEDADFAELARERTLETQMAEEGGAIGWQPLAALSAEARAAVEGLGAGELSAVVFEAPFYDVYLVTEREDARPLEEDQIETLGVIGLIDWLELERDAVAFEIDLSDGEERWILEQVIDDLQSAQTRPPLTTSGGGS
jgi:parvulin-like peptidyl-prolyl isomerase